MTNDETTTIRKIRHDLSPVTAVLESLFTRPGYRDLSSDERNYLLSESLKRVRAIMEILDAFTNEEKNQEVAL